MNTEIYLGFIRDTLRTDGVKVADTVNKLALKSGRITLGQYRLAARIIASALFGTI